MTAETNALPSPFSFLFLSPPVPFLIAHITMIQFWDLRHSITGKIALGNKNFVTNKVIEYLTQKIRQCNTNLIKAIQISN